MDLLNRILRLSASSVRLSETDDRWLPRKNLMHLLLPVTLTPFSGSVTGSSNLQGLNKPMTPAESTVGPKKELDQSVHLYRATPRMPDHIAEPRAVDMPPGTAADIELAKARYVQSPVLFSESRAPPAPDGSIVTQEGIDYAALR